MPIYKESKCQKNPYLLHLCSELFILYIGCGCIGSYRGGWCLLKVLPQYPEGIFLPGIFNELCCLDGPCALLPAAYSVCEDCSHSILCSLYLNTTE